MSSYPTHRADVDLRVVGWFHLRTPPTGYPDVGGLPRHVVLATSRHLVLSVCGARKRDFSLTRTDWQKLPAGAPGARALELRKLVRARRRAPLLRRARALVTTGDRPVARVQCVGGSAVARATTPRLDRGRRGRRRVRSNRLAVGLSTSGPRAPAFEAIPPPRPHASCSSRHGRVATVLTVCRPAPPPAQRGRRVRLRPVPASARRALHAAGAPRRRGCGADRRRSLPQGNVEKAEVVRGALKSEATGSTSRSRAGPRP